MSRIAGLPGRSPVANAPRATAYFGISIVDDLDAVVTENRESMVGLNLYHDRP